MKLIPLSKGYFAQVDDEDYEYLNLWKWWINRNPRRNNPVIYAIRRKIVEGKERIVWMHREVVGLYNPTLVVDHKDGDGLNNQRENLRIASAAENSRNRGKQINSNGTTSNYKGVSIVINKSNKKDYMYWRSSVYINGKQKHTLFKTEKEAAEYYNRRAVEVYGEFAKLNKIE